MDNKNVQPPKRKYFEVFGDTLTQLNIFKTTTIFSIMLCIFLAIILHKSINKPPLVIRIDSLGNVSAYKDAPTSQAVSPIEVSNFIQHFLQYYMSYNFYTYDEDFNKAFKMMSLECQQKCNDYLSVHRIVENIKSNQLKTKLNISEIITLKDSPDYVNIKVKATSVIKSYKATDFFREEIFDCELSLKKVERTFDAPWGLMVDSWNVQYYKR